WNIKRMLIHMVCFIGWREHFALIDVINTERFEDLRLGKMADAALGHYRNRNGFHDLANLFRRCHARNPAFGADLRRNAFERHHRNRAGLLGDLSLARIRHVHDDAAFEHFGEAGLQAKASRRTVVLRHVEYLNGYLFAIAKNSAGTRCCYVYSTTLHSLSS